MLDIDQQIRSLKAQICRIPKGKGIIQFVVGEPSANTYYSRGDSQMGDLTLLQIPSNNQTQLIVNECCIVVDSAILHKDNALVAISRADRLSVSFSYTNMRLIVTLNSFKNNSLYRLDYEYYQ